MPIKCSKTRRSLREVKNRFDAASADVVVQLGNTKETVIQIAQGGAKEKVKTATFFVVIIWR